MNKRSDLAIISEILTRALSNREIHHQDLSLLHDALQRCKEELIDPSKGYGNVRSWNLAWAPVWFAYYF